MNYQTEQANTREKLKPTLIYTGGTLDLGIKDAKRTLPAHEVRLYKIEAWKRLRIALAEEKG